MLGLGSALEEYRERLPVWRGHNEQGMALAAVGYASATHRRQVGWRPLIGRARALNMVTAAGRARQPAAVLLLPGDTFASRTPDPVLQQIEPFGDATVSVNDAFRAVSRFFDRITRPEQLVATLPQVARVLTDPADCGPVALALPQDVQGEAADFPAALFAPVLHRVPRRARTAPRWPAVAVLRGARRPLLLLGGGVRYSGAGAAVLAFADGVPVTETAAGRTPVAHEHPLHAGPIGVTGPRRPTSWPPRPTWCSRSAPGCRTSPPRPGRFPPSVRLVTLNTARFDAVKHGASRWSLTRRRASPSWGRCWTAGRPRGWTGRASTARALGTRTCPRCARARGGSPTYAQWWRGERRERTGRLRAQLVGRLPGRADRRVALRRDAS